MAFFEASSAHNALSEHYFYILLSYKSSGYILWFPVLHCYGISVCVCEYVSFCLYVSCAFNLFHPISVFILFYYYFKIPVYILMRER